MKLRKSLSLGGVLLALLASACGTAEQIQVGGSTPIESSSMQPADLVDSGLTVDSIEYVLDGPNPLMNDSSPRSVEDLVDRFYGGFVGVVANPKPRGVELPGGAPGLDGYVWDLKVVRSMFGGHRVGEVVPVLTYGANELGKPVFEFHPDEQVAVFFDHNTITLPELEKIPGLEFAVAFVTVFRYPAGEGSKPADERVLKSMGPIPALTEGELVERTHKRLAEQGVDPNVYIPMRDGQPSTQK